MNSQIREPADRSGKENGDAAATSLRKFGLRYGGAVVAVAAVAGFRWLLQDLGTGELPPYITFYPLVALVAMLAGGGPGVLAAFLSAAITHLWTLAPAGVHTAADIAGMGLFLSSCLIISAMGGMLRHARRVEKAVLEEQVAERTDALQQANARLRESEARLRVFIEHAPAALAMFDNQMNYLAVSRRWTADYHLNNGSLSGRSHYDIFPEIPERWKAVHRRGLAGEIVQADEDRFERADGSVQWLRWDVRPWRTATGAVGGVVIFTEDITARKLAEQALLAGEQELRRARDSLEARVQERTAELAQSNQTLLAEIKERERAEAAIRDQAAMLRQKTEELERFNRLLVGREQRMIELKKQINRLAQLAGQQQPYDLSFVELR